MMSGEEVALQVSAFGEITESKVISLFISILLQSGCFHTAIVRIYIGNHTTTTTQVTPLWNASN
jgi:hypothetical protein